MESRKKNHEFRLSTNPILNMSDIKKRIRKLKDQKKKT
jgi:hypothetical protein